MKNHSKPRRERQHLKSMFDAVPARYDILNRVLTLRLDERWRKRAARTCLAGDPSRVLDLCCGTGDLARHLAVEARNAPELVGLDYSPPMLEVARRKTEGLGVQQPRFLTGDAADMPFADGHFDVVGIAFAFRNLTWRNPLKEAALGEVLRVLRPGGIFVIVETSQPKSRLLRGAFHTYLSAAVSSIGGVLSRHKAAYRYLAESARKFHGPDEVCAMLIDAGFDTVEPELLLGGIAAIYVAAKPAESSVILAPMLV